MKLLAEFEGVALVRRSAQVALGSSAHAVIVVTGHRRLEIEAALDGLGVECIENTKYDHGMATSLTTGISYCDARGANAVLVLLADMPGLTTAHLDRLLQLSARPTAKWWCVQWEMANPEIPLYFQNRYSRQSRVSKAM
ncbi:NTP transferase domain-containing protein [Ochrobactrum tritici]|uniref:NTP transferase domain-containing protein n=1 Tax=Brucella tritici TaxID=94626 RepID=A0A7X6FRH4_9HYPH|nr:NTP transferase domain-containing protein [Brucella tritici]